MTASVRTGCVRWLTFACVVSVAFAAGCGASSGPLSGKVTYNGASLKGGNVTFISTSGKPSKSSSIREDGTYSVDKIVAGTYKVTVETESLKPTAPGPGGGGGMPNYPGKAMPGAVAPPKSYSPPPGANVQGGYTPSGIADNSKRYVKIPALYADSEQTPLTVTISGATKTHDIDIK